VGYGGRPVIAGIDLAIRSGAVLGLLGANGSGKSTLIKSITGQLRPWTGTVAIDGIDLARAPERAKARFGLAIDVADLPASLSGRQYLELVASLRSCAPTDWPDRDLLARLGVTAWLDRPISEYSLGTRAKIAIAAALLGSPPLLIFDESLNGLDPVAAWEVKSLLMELAASRRHAVIISTHVVETIPSLCNRAVFLAEGTIVQDWDDAALSSVGSVAGGFEACVMQTLREHAAAIG
jgi:ABC-2 type transport system ATP-binding protein